MPIRPENRDRYPKTWKIISYCLRVDRAKLRCEWTSDGKRCEGVHLQPHPVTGSKVVLTTMHLDHTPENCHPSNLLVACQLHHNSYDAEQRKKNRRQRLDRVNGQTALFER